MTELITQEEVDQFVIGEPVEEYEVPSSCRRFMPSQDYHNESPTSILNFIDCPYKWWVDRYLPVKTFEVTIFSISGTVFHRIAEVFYNEPAEKRTKEHLDKVFKRTWSELKNHGETGIIDPSMQEEFDKVVEDAKNPDSVMGFMYKLIRTCVDNLLEFDGDPSEVKVIKNEKWVRYRVNGVTVRGKIDRVRTDSMNRTIIEDFKTGAVPESEDISPLDSTYLPCFIYSLIYAKETALGEDDLNDQVHAMKLLYVKNLERINVKVTPQDFINTELILDTVTREMKRAVNSRTLSVKPASSPNKGQCAYCPAKTLGVCPQWNDSGTTEELKKMGKEL